MQRLVLTLFPQVALPGLTRVSLGIENSAEDIDAFIDVLGKIALQPRTGMDRRFASPHNRTSDLPLTDIQQQMDDFSTAAAQRVYTQ